MTSTDICRRLGLVSSEEYQSFFGYKTSTLEKDKAAAGKPRRIVVGVNQFYRVEEVLAFAQTFLDQPTVEEVSLREVRAQGELA
ncbi:hypothetical protein [Pseudooceanicola sp. LIPI14-2-Ac024]|uniref:hypothetical protein n=1 Tax=Pseudooceanicola sp. LIPI14-2-Ac024 TaxID=3344875 RepID=UPI0035CF8FF8